MSEAETTFAIWQFLIGLSTAFSAVFASVTAYVGLSTWREQQRWQQGRGLAVGLLRASNQVKQIARKARSDFNFIEDASKSFEERQASYAYYSGRVETFLADLTKKLDDFEELAIEAKLLWRAPFDEQISSFRDVENSIKNFVITGLGSTSPNATAFDKKQNREMNAELRNDIYGRDTIYSKIDIAISDIESVVLAQFPR